MKAHRTHAYERLTMTERMFLALQHATVPEQFGAVLVLDAGGGVDERLVLRALRERVLTVPRLRQRIMRVSASWGTPVWVDDPQFRVERHVEVVPCPAPGAEPDLLDVAAGAVTRPLPLDRPLWRAVIVPGLEDGRVALVLVLQHALADGIAGLAVLDALVDKAAPAVAEPFPAPPPSAGRLAADAVLGCGAAVASLPTVLRAAALRRPWRSATRGSAPPSERIGRAAPCSLLMPTGPRRRVAVARVSLAEARRVARDHRATVNDLLLTAVAGALRSTLERHRERVPAVLVGVPVAERQAADARSLGNRFRQLRAAIPTTVDPLDRLDRVATAMPGRKQTAHGPTFGAIASLLFRMAMTLGVYDLYMRRQRYLHTVVTNLHGPERPLTFCGAPVVEMLPLAVGFGGNVAATFAALSYAGTLVVTVTADPDAMPDVARTAADLQHELDVLARPGPLVLGAGRPVVVDR
jgi:diacylglycerol O-acyltransferase / wax synthase